MSDDLRELADIMRASARNSDGVRADIETAIQALLLHQVVYSDTPGLAASAVDAMHAHRAFLERWFRAAGMYLVYEPREQMVGLSSGGRMYGWKQARLRKDETLVRLALRHILDNGASQGVVDELGRVASDTDELVDTYRTLGRCEPPNEARLEEILRGLGERGAIRRSQRDRVERVTPLVILPGLRIHVPDSFAQAVAAWVEGGCRGASVLQPSLEAAEVRDRGDQDGQDDQDGAQALPGHELDPGADKNSRLELDPDVEN